MVEAGDGLVELKSPGDQIHELRVGEDGLDAAFEVGQDFTAGFVEAVHLRHQGNTIGEVVQERVDGVQVGWCR